MHILRPYLVILVVLTSTMAFSSISPDTLTVGWGENGSVIIEDSTEYGYWRMDWINKNRVMVLPDTNTNLTYAAVQSTERQVQFIPFYDELEWDTPGVEKYWHKATISNIHNVPVDLWWYTGAAYSELFDEDTSGAVSIHAGGKNPPYGRSYQYYPTALYGPIRLIPIHLKANEVKTFIWFSERPDYNKRYESRTLGGILLNDKYIQQKQEEVVSENYRFLFIIGIITAITLFLFIYYVIYRDMAFFALALLALGRLVFLLNQTGIFLTVFMGASSSKTGAFQFSEYVLISLMVFTHYFYTSEFLILKQFSPRWKQVLRWASIGTVGIIVIDGSLRFLLLPHAFGLHVVGWHLINTSIAALACLNLIIGAHLTIRKTPMAAVYLLGNIFALLGIALSTLSMNFDTFNIFRGSDKWGVALMLVTFSVALALRMRSMESKVIRIDADLQAATELDAMKTSFFTSISHEFRTPLTLIMSPLEKLHEETSDKRVKGRLELILHNAKRMQNLINQVLELAKVQSSKAILKVTEHNFIRHIKTVAAAHQSLAESKDIHFQTHLPDEPLSLYYDREMMNKIVNNLLSNAFKYCSETGEVIISVSKQSDNVSLKVENSSDPISPEDQERIFNHFQRLESSHHQVEGSGIGLSLVQDYVKLHGGEIKVHSQPTENIAFIVTLPMGSKHFNSDQFIDETESPTEVSDGSIPSAASSEGNDTEASPDKEKPLVLVVEDNQDMHQFISEELEDIYAVSVAFNGLLGLEAAKETIPDLIISDVMMPEMDGFTFLEKTRSDPLLCHIPIIMLTALSTDEAKFKGLETGADDYLLKPFNTRELRIRVANLIRQRERLRERFTLDQAQDLKDVTVSSMDEKFLRSIMDSIESNMADMEFGVKQLSEEVFMSRSQLFRKLSALTNLSPTDFIRTQRLKRAANLLEQHSGNVTEIAYMVGFQNPAHFATSFKKQYGVSPSKYSPAS